MLSGRQSATAGAVAAVLVGAVAIANLSAVAQSTPVPARVSSSCLTPKQDKELRHAIAGIQITLSATVTALDIAAAAESKPKTKHELEEAATVIKDVNKYLVSNLTAIVDSACGNCSQIVRVVNESATVIEQTLAHIDPSLRNTTAWKLIVEAVQDVLGIAAIVCPSEEKASPLRALSASAPVPARFLHGVGDACFNATQRALLRKIVAGIQIVLTTAEVSLDVAADAEKDPKTKKELQEASTVIKAVSQDLVGNLTKIARSPCANCTDVVNLVEQTVHALEDTINQINPSWEKDPLWKSIMQAIDDIFGYVKVLCPDTSKSSPVGLRSAVHERFGVA